MFVYPEKYRTNLQESNNADFRAKKRSLFGPYISLGEYAVKALRDHLHRQTTL